MIVFHANPFRHIGEIVDGGDLAFKEKLLLLLLVAGIATLPEKVRLRLPPLGKGLDLLSLLAL